MLTFIQIKEMKLKFSGVNEDVHLDTIGCLELSQLLCLPFGEWVRFCFLG